MDSVSDAAGFWGRHPGLCEVLETLGIIWVFIGWPPVLLAIYSHTEMRRIVGMIGLLVWFVILMIVIIKDDG